MSDLYQRGIDAVLIVMAILLSVRALRDDSALDMATACFVLLLSMYPRAVK